MCSGEMGGCAWAVPHWLPAWLTMPGQGMQGVQQPAAPAAELPVTSADGRHLLRDAPRLGAAGGVTMPRAAGAVKSCSGSRGCPAPHKHMSTQHFTLFMCFHSHPECVLFSDLLLYRLSVKSSERTLNQISSHTNKMRDFVVMYYN